MCKYILKFHMILLNSTGYSCCFLIFPVCYFASTASWSLGSKLQGMKLNTFFILSRTAAF